jgi:hypothetical protein
MFLVRRRRLHQSSQSLPRRIEVLVLQRLVQAQELGVQLLVLALRKLVVGRLEVWRWALHRWAKRRRMKHISQRWGRKMPAVPMTFILTKAESLLALGVILGPRSRLVLGYQEPMNFSKILWLR